MCAGRMWNVEAVFRLSLISGWMDRWMDGWGIGLEGNGNAIPSGLDKTWIWRHFDFYTYSEHKFPLGPLMIVNRFIHASTTTQAKTENHHVNTCRTRRKAVWCARPTTPPLILCIFITGNEFLKVMDTMSSPIHNHHHRIEPSQVSIVDTVCS